jgi:hypothetical protein
VEIGEGVHVPKVCLGAGDAEAVFGRVLTAVNHRGADSKLLEVALSQLAQAGTAGRYLQEELEREALAGHLVQLRHAWREAEDIAAIADALVARANEACVQSR